MSYTLTLACGCTVYVHEDVHRAAAPVRTLQGRGDRCPTPRHAVGVRVWLWEFLPTRQSFRRAKKSPAQAHHWFPKAAQANLSATQFMTLAMLVAASIAAGAIASVAGFGIGTVLTPVFALQVDMKLAVAAVSVPHLVATSLRLWMMRRHVDWRIVRTFGVMSAAGGLAGALLQQRLRGPGLVMVFGGLLIFAGLTGLSGAMERIRLGRTAAWITGVLSGVFGGLVGNQGGIRAAALLGFDVRPSAFVASATAAALMVDLARMPVYLVQEADRLPDLAGPIALAAAGAIAGTIGGERVLRRIPPPLFKKLVSALVLALGTYMLTSS